MFSGSRSVGPKQDFLILTKFLRVKSVKWIEEPCAPKEETMEKLKL